MRSKRKRLFGAYIGAKLGRGRMSHGNDIVLKVVVQLTRHGAKDRALRYSNPTEVNEYGEPLQEAIRAPSARE